MNTELLIYRQKLREINTENRFKKPKQNSILQSMVFHSFKANISVWVCRVLKDSNVRAQNDLRWDPGSSLSVCPWAELWAATGR